MTLFYDKDGKELTVLEWANKYEDEDYRIVKQTKILQYLISSIWTGIPDATTQILTMLHPDMEFPPLIFETVIFNRNTNEHEMLAKHAVLEECIDLHDSLVKQTLQEAN